MAKFCDSDIWLLQAIIWASRNEKGDIQSIIESADAINHAILNWDEVRDGLPKLAEEGYIVQSHDKFSPTKKAITAYDSVDKKKSLYQQRQILLNSFNDIEASKKIQDESFYGCSKDEFEKAMHRYIGSQRK